MQVQLPHPSDVLLGQEVVLASLERNPRLRSSVLCPVWLSDEHVRSGCPPGHFTAAKLLHTPSAETSPVLTAQGLPGGLKWSFSSCSALIVISWVTFQILSVLDRVIKYFLSPLLVSLQRHKLLLLGRLCWGVCVLGVTMV